MRVAIHQRRRDERAAEIGLFPLRIVLWPVRPRADPDNPRVVHRDRRVLNEAVADLARDHRRGLAVSEYSARHALAHLLAV